MTQGSTVSFLFIVSTVSSAEPVCPGLSSGVTVSSQVRSARESGCAVDATSAISTRHRGERSPETGLTYHAAGRSQWLSVQRCTRHYPLEGHVTLKTPPNQTEHFAVTNPVCPQNMNMTSFSSNRSLLSPRRQPLNSKSSLNRPTAVTGPFGPSSGSHVDSGSEFYQISWKHTQIQVTDSSFQQ